MGGAVPGWAPGWSGTWAGERRLDVLPALRPLFPEGGVQRGTTVLVTSAGPPVVSALALSLLAGPTGGGSWGAAVGLPALGLVAAAQMGVALERLALVPRPGGEWPTVAAALLDSVDVVVVRPSGRPRPGDARRLAARARERGSVAIILDPTWPERADVHLTVTAAAWSGLGAGHGHLQGRRVEVVASGRGAAARERRAHLWLPGPAGAVAEAPAAVDRGATPRLVRRVS